MRLGSRHSVGDSREYVSQQYYCHYCVKCLNRCCLSRRLCQNLTGGPAGRASAAFKYIVEKHMSIHHFSVSDLVCIHRFIVYMQTHGQQILNIRYTQIYLLMLTPKISQKIIQRFTLGFLMKWQSFINWCNASWFYALKQLNCSSPKPHMCPCQYVTT